MSNWGKGVINNIGWGQGSTNNSNGWGSAYKRSFSGQTLLELETLPPDIQSLINRSDDFEAQQCLVDLFAFLNNEGIYNKLNQVITPNGYGEGKLFSLKGDDVDWERLSGATRVNQNGLIESVAVDLPRLDYLKNSCPDILVEEQRTNLFIDNTNYSNVPLIGTMQKELLVNELAGLNVLKITTDSNLGTNTYLNFNRPNEDVIISFFCKSSTNSIFIIHTTKFLSFEINPSTKQIVGGLELPSYFKFTDFIDGYVLFEYLWETEGGVNRIGFRDDLNNEVFIAGYQSEPANNFATSRILTTGSTATRSADAPQPITVPSETTHIVEKLSDGSLNVIDSGLPSDYTPDFGRYKFIAFGENLTAQDIQNLENYGL